MRINYILSVEIETDEEYLNSFNAFKKLFNNHQGEFPNLYIFQSKDEIIIASNEAKGRKLKHRVTYEIIPTGIQDFKAYKLTSNAIHDISNNLKKIKSNHALYDIKSAQLFTDNFLKDILDKHSLNITWDKLKDGIFELKNSTEAQYSVIINNPQIEFKNTNIKDTYTIIGDGVQIIHQDDAEILKRAGIICYNSVQTPNGVFKIPKTYIISSDIRKVLSNNKILTDFIFPIFVEGQESLIDTFSLINT